MKLRMKSKIASLHSKIEITDDDGKALYHVHSKVFSLHNVTFIARANGDEVATITRKPVSLHETHFIEMADGTAVEIRTELWHATKDVLNIDDLGWYLIGDLVQHNYRLMDEQGQMLAQAHRKWMSLHNTYEVEIEDEDRADKIVAVLIALDKIVEDRQRTMLAPSGDSEPGKE